MDILASVQEAIAEALPELRAQAEARMVDTCRVTTSGDATWDEGSGSHLPSEPVVIYEGPCRLRNTFGAPYTADAGETVWAVDMCTVSVPVDGTAGISNGHDVEILSCPNDPGMVGLRLVVQAPHFQTDSTARRLSCQMVTRDA